MSLKSITSCLGPGSLLGVLLLSSLVACSDNVTALVVTVEALEVIGEPTALDVTFQQANLPPTRAALVSSDGPVFPVGGRTATFVIKADGRVGLADVAVNALDASQRVVGKGQATAVLVAQTQVPVTIRLHPSDFQLNAISKDNQFFTTAAPGRQVAADDKGNFVAVWEDSCPTLQCRIYARMFDRLGAPRIKEDTGKKDEFVATESTSDNYDMPAVAMQGDGAFVIVWKRFTTAPGGKATLHARAFDASGRPNPQNAIEQQLSLTSAESVASPDITRLTGEPGYIVVWEEISNLNTVSIFGRRLDAAAKPLDSAPFLVASFTGTEASGNACQTSATCPLGEHCVQSTCRAIPAEPAVAAGTASGSYMAIWKQNGSLNGRAYAAGVTPPGSTWWEAQPASNAFDIARVPTRRAGPADISSLPYGYVVLWTDSVAEGADSDGSAIRARRFDIGGEPLEDDYTFNTTTTGNQSQPSIAMRDDGNLLAAWTTDHSTADDPMGGIRGRLLLSNGLPLGRDFQVNTTVAEAQLAPTVATRGNESAAGFIVAFEDSSKAGPDTEGSGLRARLISPGAYDARDQQIGALCASANDCGAALYCASTRVGNRCVSTCAGVDTACVNGGNCVQPSEAGAPFICTYRTGP